MNSQWSESSVGDNEKTQTDNKKYYSILPDLATGWRPRNHKIAAPILITYQQPLIDGLFQYYCSNMSRLIYIGPRYDNSYKYHAKTEHTYIVKYGLKFQEVPKKLQAELQQYSSESLRRNSPFIGMNPILTNNNKKQLKFEANFQSANLDLVIKSIHQNYQYCYNIFLRPDTNTQGHMQWFYFKVSNQKIGKKTVKFNICNNKRAATLYNRGMKPYIYSKYLQKIKGIKWKQGGNNITYKKYDNLDADHVTSEISNKYYNLSFDYTFQVQNDEVFFAYCPPYTFSDLKNMISVLKRKVNSNISVIQTSLGTSLSGLQIPVLTITDENIPEQEKKCIVAMGRIHPGQSNGSFVVKGFLDYLTSPQAQDILKRVIFKIIPMINPDGVIFGNYRTSLAGKDLNRTLRNRNDQLFPQTHKLKEFIIKLKKQSKAKVIYFMDFHGHSMKKNCFVYGPDYDIWSAKYQKSKVLPKILSSKTMMFRYQSCLFRVAAGKRKTARAFMLNLIPFCYTIQTSVGLYRAFEKGMNFQFDCQKYEQLGYIIGSGVKQSVYKIFDEFGTFTSAKKKKTKKIIEKQKQAYKNIRQDSIDEDNSKQNSIRQGQLNYRSTSSKSLNQSSNKKYLNNIKNFKTPFFNVMNLQFPQINEVEGQSDGFSEGKSDCQSNDNDFDKSKYQQISGKIKKFIENFNNQLLGKTKKQFRTKNKKKSTATMNSITSIQKNRYNSFKKKSEAQQMKMVPSLKHKLAKKDISIKKIYAQDCEDQLRPSKLSIHKDDRK